MLLLFVVLTGALGAVDGATCDPKYAKYENHVMCEDDTCFGGSERIRSGLSDVEKIALLDGINKVRSAVARGIMPMFFPARQMHEMLWNEEYEKVAQKHTDTCNGFFFNQYTYKIDDQEVGRFGHIAQYNTSDNAPVLIPENFTFNIILDFFGESCSADVVHPKVFQNKPGSSTYLAKPIQTLLQANALHLGCGLTTFTYFYPEAATNEISTMSLVLCYTGPYVKQDSGIPYYEFGDPECAVKSLHYEGLCSTTERNKVEFKQLPCENETFASRANNSLYCRGDQFFYDQLDRGIPFPYVKCDFRKHKIRFWLFVSLTIVINLIFAYSVLWYFELVPPEI